MEVSKSLISKSASVCVWKKESLEFCEVSNLPIGEESRPVVYRSSDRLKKPRVPHKPKLILVCVAACNFRLPRRALTNYIHIYNF